MIKTKFSSETLEGVWLRALQNIVSFGKKVPEKDSFIEITNLQVSYTNAFETDSPNYIRIFGKKWVEYIERVYSPEGDKETGRNYYNLIRKQEGVNQVDSVIKILTKDTFSRSAIIVLSSPKIEKKPCITEIAFSIREGLLHVSIFFKSSDFAKKFIPDMIEISRIHREISQKLHVPRGSITAFILTAQVYEKDIPTIKKNLSKLKKDKYFKTEAVIENWDKEAENWDQYIKDPNHYVNFENGYLRFLKFMKDEIPRVNSSSSLALDSGCGTGIISEVLNKKGYKTVGIDISPKMLKFAHKKGSSRDYLLANSLDIPYSDNSIEVICSRGVLFSHVGKKYTNLFIKEHHRVLKSGGLFMFDFITHFNKNETKKKKNKAAITFKDISQLVKNNGFEILKRSGEDTNRVNAIVCKKI